MEKSMTSATTLSHRLETDAENVVFIRNNELWTNGRLASEIERLGRGLVERGIRPGDGIALHMANLPELIVAYHACFRVGAIAAPLNIRFKTAELRSLLQRLQPALYVQLSECAQSVEPEVILDFAMERLADYKVPETLEIVDHIPRNTLGKIDRQAVLTRILNCGSRGTRLS
jgi:acyl-CoA synthetase (AMP-forming)/AMP-acid ligase II